MTPTNETIILVVDDDKAWRDAMTMLLTPHGITPILVDSAEAAIEYLKHNRVDVLVTDTNMHRHSGIYLLEYVRARDKEIPIIVFFSGLIGSDLTVDDVLRKGATAVLEKGEAMVRLVNLLTLAKEPD